MPLCCSPCQLSGGLPVGEVFVVHFDHERFFRPNEVRPLVFNRLEYPKEFKVMSVVVLFHRGERSGVVCDGVSFPWCDPFYSPVLQQDCSYSIL